METDKKALFTHTEQLENGFTATVEIHRPDEESHLLTTLDPVVAEQVNEIASGRSGLENLNIAEEPSHNCELYELVTVRDEKGNIVSFVSAGLLGVCGSAPERPNSVIQTKYADARGHDASGIWNMQRAWGAFFRMTESAMRAGVDQLPSDVSAEIKAQIADESFVIFDEADVANNGLLDDPDIQKAMYGSEPALTEEELSFYVASSQVLRAEAEACGWVLGFGTAGEVAGDYTNFIAEDNDDEGRSVMLNTRNGNGEIVELYANTDIPKDKPYDEFVDSLGVTEYPVVDDGFRVLHGKGIRANAVAAFTKAVELMGAEDAVEVSPKIRQAFQKPL